MTEVLMQSWMAVLPLILAAIAELTRRAIARAAAAAEERWGFQIDEDNRRALHSALMTGITAALGRGLSGPDAIAAAIGHVLGRGAPDAVEHFRIGSDDLRTLAEAKLWEALQRRPPAAASTPGAIIGRAARGVSGGVSER